MFLRFLGSGNGAPSMRPEIDGLILVCRLIIVIMVNIANKIFVTSSLGSNLPPEMGPAVAPPKSEISLGKRHGSQTCRLFEPAHVKSEHQQPRQNEAARPNQVYVEPRLTEDRETGDIINHPGYYSGNDELRD